MLQDIQFCSCSRHLGDELTSTQCMIFSFSPRAIKILSPSYIEKITVDTLSEEIDAEDDSPESTEPPAEEDSIEQPEEETDESLGEFTIYKIGENKWRISVRQLDLFLSSLFRYLPGYFEPMEPQLLIEGSFGPVCCLAQNGDTANSSPVRESPPDIEQPESQ